MEILPFVIRIKPDKSTQIQILLLFLIGCLFTVSTAAAQIPGKYLQQAGENNPELKAAFYRYQAALDEIPLQGTLDDPEIGFGWFVSPVETRVGEQEVRLSLTQMLPWFGTLSQRRSVNSEDARSKFEVFREYRNRLFYSVQERWYELYFAAKTISVIEKNIQLLESLEETAAQQYESGKARQVDILQAQIEKEELLNRLEIQKDEYEVIKIDFNNLLNRASDEEVEIASQLQPVPELLQTEDLFRQVLEQNPTLLQLEYEARARSEAITLAEKENKPSFYVGMDYFLVSERPVEVTENGQDAFMLRGTVKVPIFKKKNHARVEQQRRLEAASESKKELQENRLNTSLETALKDFRNAERNLALAGDIQIQRTEEAIEMLLAAFAAEEADFEEVLRMQQRLLDYQLMKEKALSNMHISKSYIEYLTGRHNITPDEF